MGSVIAGLSMSLDGFVVGRGDGPAHPLGEGGGRVPRSIGMGNDPCPARPTRQLVIEWTAELRSQRQRRAA